MSKPKTKNYVCGLSIDLMLATTMFTVAQMDDDFNPIVRGTYTTLEGAVKRIMYETLVGIVECGGSTNDYSCDVCKGVFKADVPESYRLGYCCLRCYDWDCCEICFTENKMQHKHLEVDRHGGGLLGVYDAVTKQDNESLAALLQTGRQRENSGVWWVEKTTVDENLYPGRPSWEILHAMTVPEWRQSLNHVTDFDERFPVKYNFLAEWIPKNEWFVKMNGNKTIADIVNINFP